MADLVFYTHPMSRGRIARWMLEETGEPYRVEILDYGTSMKAPAYLALNPMGKVPTLQHGEAIVSEVAAICAYLAATFPQAGLAPQGDGERAAYYRWLFFAAGPVEAAVTNRALQCEPPAERARMVGYGTYEQTMNALEKAVSAHDFIAGNRFTAADVYVGAQIDFGLTFGSIEKRPAFETYRQRVTDRPAYRKAKELDDAAAAALKT